MKIYTVKSPAGLCSHCTIQTTMTFRLVLALLCLNVINGYERNYNNFPTINSQLLIAKNTGLGHGDQEGPQTLELDR